MTSVFCRPLDLFIVTVFVSFLAIAVTIDYTQAVYGSVLAEEDIDVGTRMWPPTPVLKAYAWWCEHVDPLLAHNPLWYETMAGFSPFLYVPFYIFAIYAFIMEREWIRVPALMWGYGLLLTMIVVLREELYGVYSTKDTTLFFAAYSSYALMPILIMFRVAWTPVFGKRGGGGNTAPVTNSSGNAEKNNEKKRKQKKTKTN